jgi:hypothetical protein
MYLSALNALFLCVQFMVLLYCFNCEFVRSAAINNQQLYVQLFVHQIMVTAKLIEIKICCKNLTKLRAPKQ